MSCKLENTQADITLQSAGLKIESGFFESKAFLDDFGDWVNGSVVNENGQMPRITRDGSPHIYVNKAKTQAFYFNKDNVKKPLLHIKFATIPMELRDTLSYEVTDVLLEGLFREHSSKDAFSVEDLIEATSTLSEFYDRMSAELIEEGVNEHVEISLLNSKEDYLEEMRKRLKAIGIKYQEFEEEEGETGEDEDTTNPESSNAIKQRASYERASEEKAATTIKMMLEFLPKYDGNGNLEFSQLLPERPVRLNPSTAWAVLLPAFANIPFALKLNSKEDYSNIQVQEGSNTVQVYLDRLEKLAKQHPWAEILHLTLSNASLQTKLEFVTAFNNVKNRIYTSEYTPGVGITTKNTEESGDNTRFIVQDWVRQAINTLYNGKEANTYAINTFKRESKSAIEVLDRLYNSTTTINNFEERFSEASLYFTDAMKEAGIIFHENTIKALFYDKLEKKNNSLEEEIPDYKEFNLFTRFLKNTLSEITDSAVKPILLSSSIDTMLQPFAKTQNLLEDSVVAHMATVGKNRVYLYSLPTVLQEQINEFKADPELVKEMLKNPKYKNSLFLKAWSSLTTLSKVEPGLRGVFQERGKAKQAKDTKDIKPVDYLKLDMYNVLRVTGDNNRHDPLYNTQVPADKSSEFLINAQSFFETETIEDGTGVFFNYILDEYQEMVQARQSVIDAIDKVKAEISKTGEEIKGQELYDRASQYLKVGYTLNGKGELALVDPNGNPRFLGNAFKFRIFEGMQKLEGLNLFDGQGLPIATNEEEANDAFNDKKRSQLLRTYITNQLNERVTTFKEGFKDLGLQVHVYTTNIIATDGALDPSVIRYYTDKYKNRTDKFTTTAYEAIMRDYVLNSIASKIEYAKIFTGSLQNYKSDNDYVKRVPSTYASGLQLITGITPGDTKFKQLTFATENFKSDLLESPYLSPEVKKYYERVDRTDAQAWITPKRWKFIMERTGKFNSTAQRAYSKLEAQWDFLQKNQEIPTEYQLSTKELKLVSLQPLKGVYFKHDIVNGPTYLKYSQAVLIPSFVNNVPRAKALLQLMEKHGIDEAVADTGVKVGANKPVSLEKNMVIAEDGSITYNVDDLIQLKTLDNRNWRLQQDLPTKNIKSTKIGTQIQKIIIAGLRTLPSTVEVAPGWSGAKLADAIDNALADLSNDGLVKFKKKYGIDENFKIKNIENFYKSIINDLTEKGEYVDATVQALRAEVPLAALPGLEKQVISSFLSANKKFAVNLMTSGGAFIQMSDQLIGKVDLQKKGVIMLRDSFEGLRPPQVRQGKDGKLIVKPGQVFIPHSMIAKLIPDYHTLELSELRKRIPKEVRELIGYRIPTQSRASTDILEIVGILPEEMGDSIIAYGEITAKTGSDFDIDKMFLMFPDLHYEDFGRNPKLVKSTKGVKGKRNKVFDLFLLTLKSPVLYNAMMTSIDNDTTEDSINALLPVKKSYDLQVFDPLQALETRFNLKAGAAGIGEMVNANNDHIRSQSKNIVSMVHQGTWGNPFMDFDKSEVLTEDDLYGYEKDNIKYEGLLHFLNKYREAKEKANFTVEQIQSRVIKDVLSELTNAFVDIANKNAFITRANWGSLMNSYGTMLIRTGVHPNKVFTMFMQPAVAELVSEVAKGEGVISNTSSFVIRTRVLNKYTEMLYKKAREMGKDPRGIKIPTRLDALDLPRMLATTQTNNLNYEQLLDQVVLLNHISRTLDVTKRYSETLTTSKTGETGAGKSIGEVMIKSNKISNSFMIENGLGFQGLIDKYVDNVGNNTLLMTFYENTIDTIRKVVDANPELFHGMNSSIHNIINKVAADNSRINYLTSVATADTILDNVKMYLLSGFTPLNTRYEVEERSALIDEVFALKLLDKYAILKALRYEGANGKEELLINKVSTLKPHTKNLLIKSWELLLEEHPRIGEFLVHEAYGKSGFKLGPKNFSELISPLWLVKKGLESHVNSIQTIDYETFMNQLVRNKDGAEIFNVYLNTNNISETSIHKVSSINDKDIMDIYNSKVLNSIPRYGYSPDGMALKLVGFTRESEKNISGEIKKSMQAIYIEIRKLPVDSVYYNSNHRQFLAEVDPEGLELSGENTWENVVKQDKKVSSTVKINGTILDNYKRNELNVNYLRNVKEGRILEAKLKAENINKESDSSTNESCKG